MIIFFMDLIYNSTRHRLKADKRGCVEEHSEKNGHFRISGTSIFGILINLLFKLF